MNLELKENLEQQFAKRFKKEPLLVFSPGRINLIGEHTDYNQGYVFPAAINKGIYAAMQVAASTHSSIIALDKNETYTFDVNNFTRLSENSWQNYILGVVAEVQKRNKIVANFNLMFSGDIPLGAGLSSSAALENSIVFALNNLFNLGFTKHEMITISQQAEHNFVGVKCGIMDQYASMFGQKKTALHLDCRSMEAVPCKIALNNYELLLINTNIKHSLAESAYNDRRNVCEKVAALLNLTSLRAADKEALNRVKSKISEADYQKALYVLEENERTIKAVKVLANNDVNELGNLMYASHEGLSKKYKVSCKELDFLVTLTQKNEAVIGARMMGGGFGGCIITIVKKQEIQAFKQYVKNNYFKQFTINCSFYEVQLEDGTRLLS